MKILWKDREVEKPRTYLVENNEDGTITLRPSFGEIIEEGTKLNAENMNSIYDYVDSKTENVVIPLVIKDIENPVEGQVWIRKDLIEGLVE